MVVASDLSLVMRGIPVAFGATQRERLTGLFRGLHMELVRS